MTYSIEFEWDEAKNRANQLKHGLSFEQASLMLASTCYLESQDTDNSLTELRFMAIGELNDSLISVVYTERHDRIRIISARSANSHEKARYHKYMDQQ